MDHVSPSISFLSLPTSLPASTLVYSPSKPTRIDHKITLGHRVFVSRRPQSSRVRAESFIRDPIVEFEEEMYSEGGEKCFGVEGKNGRRIEEVMECLEREAIMGEDQGKDPTDYNRRAHIFDISSKVFQQHNHNHQQTNTCQAQEEEEEEDS